MAVVELERHGEAVALLRINRPEARNALNLEVRALLAEHVLTLGADEETRAIVITGDDKAFAAGADLRQMKDAEPIGEFFKQTQYAWRVLTECPKPMIAAVRGFALGGGCELALHADMIIAGESAKFGQPEIRVGIMPGAGGTQRLVRAVGKWKAMKIVLTGEMVSAREADAMGMVTEVVPDERVLERALELATLIAAMPPIAVRQTKEVMTLGADAPLDVALALERRSFQLLFSTYDQKEGMNAFFEKRKPKFEGR